MATRRTKKNNLMGTVTKVGALSLGGFVGDKVTSMAEQQLVKTKPELVKYAPAITTIVGILGATYMNDGLVKTGFEGMATLGLLENFQNVEATISNNTTAPESGNGDGSGSPDGGAVQGILGPARMNAGPFRMNGHGGLNYVSF